MHDMWGKCEQIHIQNGHQNNYPSLCCCNLESTIINLLTILSHDLVPRPHHCLQYRKVRAMESWVGAWEQGYATIIWYGKYHAATWNLNIEDSSSVVMSGP